MSPFNLAAVAPIPSVVIEGRCDLKKVGGGVTSNLITCIEGEIM